MWDLDLIRDARNHGEECGGIGYWGFPKGLYESPVSSGREMIDHARRSMVPIIDVTQYAPAVYQGISSPPKLLDLCQCFQYVVSLSLYVLNYLIISFLK